MTENPTIFRTTIALPDMAATIALAARIAPRLRPGDAVALWGDLGAGKTTLARAILESLGVTGTIPSPTFTLVQTYETEQLAVAHFDLYRLKQAREMDELGFEEMLQDGAVLVEWPERAPDYLPDETLHVRLSLDGEARAARLTGPARWNSLA